jgi:hypothetical protein
MMIRIASESSINGVNKTMSVSDNDYFKYMTHDMMDMTYTQPMRYSIDINSSDLEERRREIYRNYVSDYHYDLHSWRLETLKRVMSLKSEGVVVDLDGDDDECI